MFFIEVLQQLLLSYKALTEWTYNGDELRFLQGTFKVRVFCLHWGP
jgi:hypothetical protein